MSQFDVLLIGPDNDDRTHMTRALVAGGHRVSLASHGAATRTAQHRHDLVIVDLAGPQDPLRFIRSIATQKSHPPIVAVTEPGRAELASDALRLGAIDLVPRPICDGDLLAAVANAAELA
ncbi:MAG: response regulator, partial [Acidobacteria bacterium]|nr:response regulator [Acidobacteriota bacterium]